MVQTTKHFPENSASLLKRQSVKVEKKNLHGNWDETSAWGGRRVVVIRDWAENFGTVPDVGVVKYSPGP